MSERLADKTGEAAVYHQFGGISQRQDRLDDAEHWYRRALVIEEEQRDKPHIALTCHNLGTVAYGKGRLDDAEAWFHKALAIYTGLGDKPHTVGTSEMLGQLAEARGRVDQALEWTIRGVAAFAELPRSLTEPGRKHLALLAARLGLVAVEECWRKVTGDPLPTAVREYMSPAIHKTSGRVMNDPVGAIAQAAARRLTPEYGPRLQSEVEAALYARDAERRPDQYLDPVTLGSLIVSTATLAWTIYNDLRKKAPDPPPDVAARTLRVELTRHTDTTPNSDKVTEVIVAEIVSGAGDLSG